MTKSKTQFFSDIKVELEKSADRQDGEEDEEPNDGSADPQKGRHLAKFPRKSC